MSNNPGEQEFPEGIRTDVEEETIWALEEIMLDLLKRAHPRSVENAALVLSSADGFPCNPGLVAHAIVRLQMFEQIEKCSMSGMPASRITLAGLRRADKPPPSSSQAKNSEQANSVYQPTVNDGSYLSVAKLAELSQVRAAPLRLRLDRWRAKSHDGWIENPDRKPREPKYLYRVGAVRPIIDALKATSRTSNERAAK